MDDSFPHNLLRMDWGFGNPNKTAAMIALIMIVVWALAYVHRQGFWAALVLFTGFGACLILTQSRGGLVGMIVGSLIVLAWAPRPFLFWRIVGLTAACLALAAFAWVTNADSRYAGGLFHKDRSIENRLLIWEQVPTMIHDAPNGWGVGKSGDAYMQWYQPITRGEGYRTLVNSHLTWLTEFNWWGRIAYVVSWVFVFVLLWPDRKHLWFSIPFATWVALAISASFSSVAEAPLLWTIPVLALIVVLLVRWRNKIWPTPGLWLSGALVSLLLLGIIFLWGIWTASPSFVYSPHEGEVLLGSKSPRIWIVAPNRSILGEHFGHEVRRSLETETIAQQMGIGIVSDLQTIPENQIVVLSGQIPPKLSALKASQVILVSPNPVPEPDLAAFSGKVTVIVGEYSRNKDYWNEQAHARPNIKLQLVEGSEEYIPNWMYQVTKAIAGI